MKVLVLVSMCVMPDWKVFEQGETYEVDAATAQAWIAAGLAEAVDTPATASAPDAPADDATPKRKRK
jgi:hypothetical protein